MKKVIVSPKGFTPINFFSDSLGHKWTKIIFVKRGKLGKLLKIRKTRIVINPRDTRVTRIENHKPRVQSVTITYAKRRISRR